MLSLKVESQSRCNKPCTGPVLTPSIATVEQSGQDHYFLNKINRQGHFFWPMSLYGHQPVTFHYEINSYGMCLPEPKTPCTSLITTKTI